MPQFHQKTKHSYFSVRANPNYLDFATQPVKLKKYPKFYRRFKISDYPEIAELELIGKITHEVKYPNGSYFLRTVPSAGALYPIEVYLHIRGVKGVISGLYHYEPYEGMMTLIYEYIDDGIEVVFEDSLKRDGVIAFITAVYFRSSWKYGNRAIRYILLDSGHMAANIDATLQLHEKKSTLVFDFDKKLFNTLMGFEGDEMVTLAIDASTPKDRTAKRLRENLPYVAGTDYLVRNDFIEESYSESYLYFSEPLATNSYKAQAYETLKNSLLERRSIRAFYQKSINKNEFEFIFDGLFELAKTNNIEIFYTLHNVEGIENGLYLHERVIESVDFREKSAYLALEQKLGSQSALTLYFTSNEVASYQKVNILSGYIAGVIYLKATMLGVGVSGIGAYYDDETKEFLKTKNNILYLLAIGR